MSDGLPPPPDPGPHDPNQFGADPYQSYGPLDGQDPNAGLATIGRRFGARILDALIIGVPIVALMLSVSDVDLDANTIDTPGWVQLLALLVTLGYEIYFIARNGQTPGKAILKIQVVDEATGQVPTTAAAGMRVGPVMVVGIFPVIGQLAPLIFYLPALWRARRQGLHDSLARTVVVDAPR